MKKTMGVALLCFAAMASLCACDSSSDSEAPSSGAVSQVETTPYPSLADREKDVKAATDVLADWLKLIDDAKYGEAWDQTDPSFKQSSPKDAWIKQASALRTALGPTISRAVKETRFQKTMAKEPPGLFVTIHYDTAFKATDAGIEDITARLDPDGTWRALGYYVSIKPPTPTPVAKH